MANQTTNRIDFDQMASHPDYQGGGYIAQREYITDRCREVADEALNRIFKDASPEFIFEWANSKNGRWFAEESIVVDYDLSLDENVAKLVEAAKREGTI